MPGNEKFHYKIVHFTSVHPRTDTRIRVKEVATLAVKFGSVALLVQDGKGDAIEDDGRVRIIDVGAPGGRFLRAVRGSWRMWRAIRRLRPEIAHFHDPELIPVGLLLKFAGCKVIYDVHEDVPRQILSKDWMPRALRRPIATSMEAVEWLAGRVFDAIVTVTPVIARRFPRAKTVLVQNFPLLDELCTASSVPYQQREPMVVYIGGITPIRGAREMVEAMGCLPEASDLRLALAGSFSPPGLERELSKLDGWSRVIDLGWLSRDEVVDLLGRARVGFVVLHPIGNYLEAYPVKMFEYMAAGLPVIASDFPLWRRIVEEADCGLLVNPRDVQAFAEALQWVMAYPNEAEAMGQRGRKAALERYNWESEIHKLVALYDSFLESDNN